MLVDLDLPSGKRSYLGGSASSAIVDPRRARTVEALRPSPQEAARAALRDELDRIEGAVAAGNTDLAVSGTSATP